MQTGTERAWLDYAWKVVTCTEAHLARCVTADGDDPQIAGGIRYPGNLGSGYDPERGILCIGLVHRSRQPGDEGWPEAQRVRPVDRRGHPNLGDEGSITSNRQPVSCRITASLRSGHSELAALEGTLRSDLG